MYKSAVHARIRAASVLLTHRLTVLKNFACFSPNMNSAKQLEDLSKEELIAKVKSLQTQCDSLKASTSKYESMAQKFRKFSKLKKKKVKVLDPKTTHQRKIALKVSYFGWDYMGLQDNPGLKDTIESILFLALSHTKLLIESIENADYSKCGRTDRGVSAVSQIFCLKLRSNVLRDSCKDNVEDALSSLSTADFQSSLENADHEVGAEDGEPRAAKVPYLSSSDTVESECSVESDEKELDYCGILNRVLPEEIRVTAWAYVDDPDFSARHHCVGRIYKYFFPRGSLNVAAMNAACKKFIGTHDFRNFCKINVGERLVYVRVLRDFNIDVFSMPELNSEYNGPYQMCVATISGTGFLYHQVRYMMGVLFLIGMGFEDASVIDDLLDVEKTPRRPQYGLTAEFPLILYDCKFDNLKWNVSEEAQQRLHASYERLWTTMITKTALIRSTLMKFNEDVSQKVLQNAELQDDRISQHPKYMKDIKNYNIGGFLLRESWSSKQYRKILKRPTGCTLEEKIQSMENKRQRKMDAEDSQIKS